MTDGRMTGGLMAGKRGLILGVANERSIAWGIAKQCAAQGASLGFTYQGDALARSWLDDAWKSEPEDA
ncbi:MAG: SDR family oxidoreductase, partial [Pseudomonadota bacterium]